MQVKEIDRDPFNELLWDEINPIRIMHKLKMSADPGRPTGDQKEDNKWKRMRSYNHTLRTMVREMEKLEKEFEGKKFRKEVHTWAKVMLKDARLKILSSSASISDTGVASAMMDFSNAIINAFKKLKK